MGGNRTAEIAEVDAIKGKKIDIIIAQLKTVYDYAKNEQPGNRIFYKTIATSILNDIEKIK